VDSENYTLDDYDPATGSFHLTPVRQDSEDYANPVPGKINIQVTYANDVTVDLPLTVTTKTPTIKPKKTSFSFLNGVMDIQGAAVTVSPADYDLIGLIKDKDDSVAAQESFVDKKDSTKAAVALGYFEVAESAYDAALFGVKAGEPFFFVMGESEGYVGSGRLTFEIPGVKPFAVTVKFTKNTPTMRLKVNGTIDAGKTNKVTLTTTIKNLTPVMLYAACRRSGGHSAGSPWERGGSRRVHCGCAQSAQPRYPDALPPSGDVRPAGQRHLYRSGHPEVLQ